MYTCIIVSVTVFCLCALLLLRDLDSASSREPRPPSGESCSDAWTEGLEVECTQKSDLGETKPILEESSTTLSSILRKLCVSRTVALNNTLVEYNYFEWVARRWRIPKLSFFVYCSCDLFIKYQYTEKWLPILTTGILHQRAKDCVSWHWTTGSMHT